MKKFLLMLLIAVAAHGQNQSYTASTESFPNPDRGFYRYSSSGSSSSYSFISASTLSSYRAQNVSVVQRIFYLQQFTSTAISSTFLANMQTDFNTIRNAGMKVMIRFAYSNSESAAVLDANKTQMLAHIQQVAPIILANKDIISMYQYGWIGCWGENYYTSQVADFGNGDYTQYTTTQWANRKQILDAMLAATPIEIPIQVRYLFYKQKLYPTGNNRIGFYNDAFLGEWGDSGMFLVNNVNSAPSTTDSNYLIAQTENLPMTGETNQINAPRTDCANAVMELNKYNWSLMNKDYLTANITTWTSQGCYTEIERKLGYRFELLNSSFSNNTLTVNLQNSGYANVYKSRKAFVVLKNTATNTEYSVEISSDIKSWKKATAIQLTKSLAGLVPNGTYQLYLNLPDPTLTNPLFSIRCANTGTWDATKGYNNLNQTVTITSSTAADPVVTDPVVTTPIVTTPIVTTPVVTTPVVTTPVVLPVEILFIGNTTLVLNNLPRPNYNLKVYNLNGQVKATSTDLTYLRRGYYVVKVRCNGITTTKNIYKQ
jgi:hypothetical protein